MDLALNNLQRLICHKTQQTKPKPSIYLSIYLSSSVCCHLYHWVLSQSVLKAVKLINYDPGYRSLIQSHTKDLKKKLARDASLLNNQYYKVWIIGKWSNRRKWVTPSPTPPCSSYWKGSLRVSLDYGRPNLFTYITHTHTYTHTHTRVHTHTRAHTNTHTHTTQDIYIYRERERVKERVRDCEVMIIVVGNEHGSRCSNPVQGSLHSTKC